MYKLPKDDAKYHWTQHITRKMLYYGISADKIKRIIRFPERTEYAIAPETIGVMQRTGAKKDSEIWVMYAVPKKTERKTKTLSPRKKVLISAWRYPGISPKDRSIPIPPDILLELKKDNFM